MNELINHYFFPFTFLENEEDLKNLNCLERKNLLLSNLDYFSKKINSVYRVHELFDLYNEEKNFIKSQGFKIVASFLEHKTELLEKILELNNIKSTIFYDFFLKNRVLLFVEENFNDKNVLFVLKTFPVFEYISIKNLTGFNFKSVTLDEIFNTNNIIEKNILISFIKKEIENLGFTGKIFLLSDGIFSTEEKTINIFLIKLNIDKKLFRRN